MSTFILTKQEKKSIINKVMESYQSVTLSEVKTNINIKSEIHLNFKFYSEVKQGFINENKTNITEIDGFFGGILSIFGNIKDFLSGVKVIKNIAEWIKDKLNKLADYLKKFITDYVPKGETILKGGKNIADWTTNFIKKIYKTLTWPGLAKLFAMIRYRTFSPSEEQKKCMALAAQKAYRWILITLLAAFIIKILLITYPVIQSAAAIQASAPSLIAMFTPIKSALVSAGVKGVFAKLFSITSASMKVEDLKKLSKEIENEEATAKAGELDSFSEAWNKCPLSKSDKKNVDDVNTDINKRMGDMSKNMASFR